MTSSYAKSCLMCLDRTGSNYLSDVLARTPGVEHYNELFHRSMIIWSDDDIEEDEPVIVRNSDPLAFLDKTYNTVRSGKVGVEHIGFKLFVNHNLEALNYVLSSSEISVIFLTRQNYLARFSSFKIAELSGRWKERGAASEAEKIEFRFGEFAAYMENARCVESLARRQLALRAAPFLEVEYDQLRTGAAFPLIAQHLSLPDLDFAATDIVKQNTSEIASRFSNEEDVMTYLDRIGKLEWAVER